MITIIVVMHLFILSTIQEFWHVLPPSLTTLWIDGNLEQIMAGDKHAGGVLNRFLWCKSSLQPANLLLHFTNRLG
jgi:hypothetical protein